MQADTEPDAGRGASQRRLKARVGVEFGLSERLRLARRVASLP